LIERPPLKHQKPKEKKAFSSVVAFDCFGILRGCLFYYLVGLFALLEFDDWWLFTVRKVLCFIMRYTQTWKKKCYLFLREIVRLPIVKCLSLMLMLWVPTTTFA
jgi:hypothetical protein